MNSGITLVPHWRTKKTSSSTRCRMANEETNTTRTLKMMLMMCVYHDSIWEKISCLDTRIHSCIDAFLLSHSSVCFPPTCFPLTHVFFYIHTWAQDMIDAEEHEAHVGALAQLSEDVEPIAPSSRGAIVLHEDKKFYPSAEEVYGPETETMVQDEDTQPLEKPIIAPIREKWWDLSEVEIPETTYGKEYVDMNDVM